MLLPWPKPEQHFKAEAFLTFCIEGLFRAVHIWRPSPSSQTDGGLFYSIKNMN
jgi:hypothetical protein